MQHAPPVTAFDAPHHVGSDHTGQAREQLADIVTGIDAHFMQVGTLLAEAIDAIDLIAASLQEVASVFQQGDAAAAVDDLTASARRLSAVSDQVAERAGEVSCIRVTSKGLSKHVREVHKTLEMLQIYGMNVKIAASGASDFIDFANRMNEKLQSGGLELRGFDAKLAELEQSLSAMEHNDKLLAGECRKIVPQVPDRLVSDADALRAHQTKLAKLADTTSALARSIQGNVAAILGALQVGDIARQRLEHVLTGCTLLEACLADPHGDVDDQAGIRSHMMALLIAQATATSAEFRRETVSLVESLRRLQPETSRLIALRDRDGAEDDQTFLRALEAGIADAAAMVAQLQQADIQADETLGIIVATVDDLSGRAKSIRELRIDVQQMSINIVLKCRRVEAIGRPVAVIANEIRHHSDKLDDTIDCISTFAADLSSVSLRMRQQAEAGHGDGGHELSRSIEAIREGALRTETAMTTAGAKADGIPDVLRRTMTELEGCLDLGSAIDAVSGMLANGAGPDATVTDGAAQVLRMLMNELARTYTMASERIVHDQFLLPGMTALVGTIAEATTFGIDDDDDDALFDDALF